MLLDKTILPIISEVKSIFQANIIDFAILNDEGYRYTHSNKVFQYSIEIIRKLDALKEQGLPYAELFIESYHTMVFYDLDHRYFVVMVEDSKHDTPLSDFHHRLLEVSFFDNHLNLFLKYGAKEDYALVVTDFDGRVQSMNQYAEAIFSSEVNDFKALQTYIHEKADLNRLFHEAKTDSINQSYTVTTLGGLRFMLNAYVEPKLSLITFIFTLDAHASFYTNLLRGFDFLRFGVAHFELVEEDGVVIDARILYTNLHYATMMGIHLSDRIGKRIFELYPDYDEKRFNRYKDVALGAPNLSFEEYVPQLDKYLEIYCYSPRKGEFVNLYYDTSHLYIAKESEQYQIDKIRMMSTFAAMGFFEINVQEKTFKSDQYVRDLFQQPALDYETYRTVFKSIIDTEDKADIYAKNAQLLSGDIQEGSARFKVHINGQEKYLEYYLKVLKKDAQNVKPISILGLVRDVTTEEQSKRQVEFFANHDALTKLYSRYHFNQRIKTQDIVLPMKIALLDLDGLKTVNDILGHYAGDRAIKAFVEIINTVYAKDYVARVGGDEFVVLFEDENQNSAEQERMLKEKLSQSLRFNIPFSVSVGYALVNQADGFKEALLLAEDEMYKQKLFQRQKRKRETLAILEREVHRNEPDIVAHIAALEALAIPLMKALNYTRNEDVKTMKSIVRYHAIGRIDDFIHKTNYKAYIDQDTYRYLRVETGFKIISTLYPEEKVSEAILYQCEHYNGSGAPHGLAGNAIPIFSRIVAVAYRYVRLIEKAPKDQVFRQLHKEKNQRFDPRVVDALIDLIETVKK